MSADRLDDWFSGNCFSRFLEDVPLAVEQRLHLQHDGASTHNGEDIRLVERDISTMVE
jgi:hypothetical protein